MLSKVKWNQILPILSIFYWTPAFNNKNKLSSVQLLSHVPSLWDSMDCSTPDFTSLSITNSWGLLKLMSIESVTPSHLLLSSSISFSVVHFSFCLQSCPASGSFLKSQLFTSGGQSIRASASVLPVKIQDSISLRMDWLDLLAVQGTLKSLLQHHSSKASILRHSAFLFKLKFRALFIFSLTYPLKPLSVISNILFSELAIQVFMKFHA